MTRRRGLTVGGVLVAALLSGCILEPVTDSGRDVASLYWWFMLAAAVVFAIVIGLMAWSIIRFRGPAGRDAPIPPLISGNMALEVVWWALPVLLVAVLAFFTIVVLGRVDAHGEDPDVTVEVTGYQWGWQFVFPDTGVVVNGTAADPASLPLPVDRTIAFEIHSADVVHSFNIPAFLIKRDAVPTRVNRFDVVIEEEGTYGGQCGEFCGLLHARQLFEIEAMSGEDFDAWLAGQEPSEARLMPGASAP
ncbi:MAG TPA: cytochrome c oxidase subunit II [Candidatus Limnocylindria bacterium]|nr:cytochrome c oxidase subunit II [Candidatus Limnocylindria bacterium]